MSAAAGWYKDPTGIVGTDRYWDGVSWTSHTRASLPQEPAPPTGPPSTQLSNGSHAGSCVTAHPAPRAVGPMGRAFADPSQGGAWTSSVPVRQYAAKRVSFGQALRYHFKIRGNTTRGRVSVQQWAWSLYLFNPLILVTATCIQIFVDDYTAAPAGYVMSGPGSLASFAASLTRFIVVLVAFGHFVVISIKRHHDIGHSGVRVWWLLLPVVGWIMHLYWMTRPGIESPTPYD